MPRRTSRRARVGIATLGCKVNFFDTTLIEEGLDPGVFRQVRFEEEAEIYVVNTCTVTANADAQARNLIRRAKRRNPGAAVVVTGCYAAVRAAELRGMPEVDRVLGLEEKGNILPTLRALVPAAPLPVVDEGPAAPERRTRPVLKIQEGCDVYCSFCVVPYSRGSRPWSMPREEVSARLEQLRAEGFREVVLTGPYIGGYGRDLADPTSLAALLAGLARRDLGLRLRISSIQPTEIDSELLHVLADSRVFCRHLHIPLQSGDDEVLRRMNRPYGGGDYARLIEEVARRIPGVAIGADVVVGHPGEDDAAFARTRALLASLPLAYLHVFPFSARPETAAASMDGAAPPPVAKRRAAALRELDTELRLAFAAGQVGRRLDVLLERPASDPPGHLRGFSDNYLNVVVPEAAGRAGELVPVRILSARAREVRGVPATTAAVPAC